MKLMRLPLPRAAALAQRSFARSYNEYNSIDCLLGASQAWHSLAPKRALNDEQALRETFARLDLDGSGKINKDELREALLMKSAPSAPALEAAIDVQVDTMIAWADLDDDGLISFQEYKKIIQAGCAPTGGRKTAWSTPRPVQDDTTEPASPNPAPDGTVIYL